MVSPRNFLKNRTLGCGLGSALWGLLALSAACFLVLPGLAGLSAGSFHGLPALSAGPFVPGSVPAAGDGDFIRWVDFDVPEEVLERAFRWDVDTYQEELHINWVELLAYLGAKYGGDFSLYRAADMDEAAARLRGGESMDAIASGMRYYPYYLEAYGAVLNGLLGLYETEIAPEDAPDFALPTDENGRPIRDGQAVWVSKYGLKAFSPIASGFPYSEYDDFGVSRSYGYQRRHLGHDMMGQVGTPVIAVESGRVEALGWNQYGGWRIGIRSLDGKRYYYYAHLRKNYPYQSGLAVGSLVTAGDVIGYLGRTGYSAQENVNNIEEPHLHFGIQLIFDESQKEGDGEIWIDCYDLVRFLSLHRSEVHKVEGTKEWARTYEIWDPALAGP